MVGVGQQASPFVPLFCQGCQGHRPPRTTQGPLRAAETEGAGRARCATLQHAGWELPRLPQPSKAAWGGPAWLRVLPRWPLGPQLRTQSQHAPFVPDECPQQGRSVGSHPERPSRPNSPLGWGRAGLQGCCLEPQPRPPCMASHWHGSLGPGRPPRPPHTPFHTQRNRPEGADRGCPLFPMCELQGGWGLPHGTQSPVDRRPLTRPSRLRPGAISVLGDGAGD